MKGFIFAFFIITVSCTSNIPYLLITQQICHNLQFDALEFFTGFNDELGLVQTDWVFGCAEGLLPTLLQMGGALKDIVTMQWDGAFTQIPGLVGALGNFQQFCSGTTTSYINYFGPVLKVLECNSGCFFKTLLKNYEANQFNVLLTLANFIASISQGFDDNAGHQVADLIRILLAGIVPPTPTDTYNNTTCLT